MKYIQILLAAILIFIFNACGNTKKTIIPKNEVAETTDKDKEKTEEIIHNGTIYNTIISPYTKRVWLDRNLGAARVCTSYKDTACFGDYYQWGRNFDGHQDSTSSVTTKQAKSLSNAGDTFILDNGGHRGDWANKLDVKGKKRKKLLVKTDGSFICPIGFRVPTSKEFLAETSKSKHKTKNRKGAYKNFLKLPTAGFRSGDTGKIIIKHSGSLMVSSGFDDYGVDYFYYSKSDIGRGMLGSRSSGETVRCIKD